MGVRKTMIKMGLDVSGDGDTMVVCHNGTYMATLSRKGQKDPWKSVVTRRIITNSNVKEFLIGRIR